MHENGTTPNEDAPTHESNPSPTDRSQPQDGQPGQTLTCEHCGQAVVSFSGDCSENERGCRPNAYRAVGGEL